MLNSHHHGYATARMTYLESLPKECGYDWLVRMEIDILTHLLANDMDLSKRTPPASPTRPSAIKAEKKHSPKPSTGVEPTYSIHCMTDPLTGLVQMQSSQYDFETCQRRIGVAHDPARSFSITMDGQPSARAFSKTLHAFLEPKRTTHPDSKLYWYDADGRNLLAAIMHYAEGQVGVGSWAANVPPDHGLRMAKLEFNGSSWIDHFTAIIKEYAMVMGMDDRDGVLVPS